MVTPAPPAPLLEPNAPGWATRFAALLPRTFLGLFPSAPVRLWPVLFADLPPAASWTGCMVYVTDKAKVGLSNGATWTTTTGGVL